jgi:hypothetical protein
MGKLVHSFKGVELDFEPPLLLSLIANINKIQEEVWKNLYQTYIYEDFLINALSGRRINLNKNDDSCIYHVKSKLDIDARLSMGIRKIEAERRAKECKFAFKLPDIVPYLNLIKAIYPLSKFILMSRDANETISSLMIKGWFSNENLEKNVIWPYVKNNNIIIPFWVNKADSERWVEMSELDRCAYYYLKMAYEIKDQANVLVIRYSELIASPQETAEKICSIYDLKFGCLTNNIIEQIKSYKITSHANIMENISKDLLEEIRLL